MKATPLFITARPWEFPRRRLSLSTTRQIRQVATLASASLPLVDVNGDGFSDVIVGAHGQDAGATDEGNAFVYYGSASGIPTTPSVTLDNPANQAGGGFGFSVASVFYDLGRKLMKFSENAYIFLAKPADREHQSLTAVRPLLAGFLTSGE
jgi:hypothetical protein